MPKFTSETARAAGRKSRRGAAKSTIQTRKFIFQILQQNKAKLKYTMQKIDVSELSKDEITDMVKDIVDGN